MRGQRWLGLGLVSLAALGIGGVLHSDPRWKHLALPVLDDPSPAQSSRALPLVSAPACDLEPVGRLEGRVGAVARAWEGAVWAGAFDGGLFRFERGGRIEVEGLRGRERFLNALLPTPARVWAGTQAGLLAFDATGHREQTLLRGQSVQALAEGPDALYVGTPRGLFEVRQLHAAALALRGPEGESIRVTALARTEDTLWLGTPEGAYAVTFTELAKVSPRARWIPLVFGPRAAKTNVITALAALGAGVVAGTDDGGLVRIDANGTVQAVPLAEPLANLINPGAGARWGQHVLLGTQGGGLLIAGLAMEGLEVRRPEGPALRAVSALAVGEGLLVGTHDGSVFVARCG